MPKQTGKVPDSFDFGFWIADLFFASNPQSKIPNRITVAWAVLEFHQTSLAPFVLCFCSEFQSSNIQFAFRRASLAEAHAKAWTLNINKLS